MVQHCGLLTVDLSDKDLGVDMVVPVRVEGVELGTQVLQWEQTDVGCRVTEVSVAWGRDPERALPVTNESVGRGLCHVRPQSRSEQRQVAMRFLQAIGFVVVATKLVVHLRTTATTKCKNSNKIEH